MAANMRRCLFSGGNCKQQQSKFGAFFLFVFSPFAEGKGVLQVFPCHLHQWDAEKEGWGCVLLCRMGLGMCALQPSLLVPLIL